MLQQISKWIWGPNIEYNSLKIGRRYAVYKIEQAYLNYKSNQRISKKQQDVIAHIISHIRIKHIINPHIT